MIYLDTHVAEPLARGKFGLLSKEAGRLISRDGDIRISPMVVLELEYLFEIGRVKVRSRAVVAQLGASLGVRVCDRPFAEVALEASGESWTRDAFDRIIVAQARLAKAPLITRDSDMLAHYNKALT